MSSTWALIVSIGCCLAAGIDASGCKCIWDFTAVGLAGEGIAGDGLHVINSILWCIAILILKDGDLIVLRRWCHLMTTQRWWKSVLDERLLFSMNDVMWECGILRDLIKMEW